MDNGMGSQGSCICLYVLLSIAISFPPHLLNHSICEVQFEIINHPWILRHSNCNPFIPLKRNIYCSINLSMISVFSVFSVAHYLFQVLVMSYDLQELLYLVFEVWGWWVVLGVAMHLLSHSYNLQELLFFGIWGNGADTDDGREGECSVADCLDCFISIACILYLHHYGMLQNL